jgi:hypothetical protein
MLTIVIREKWVTLGLLIQVNNGTEGLEGLFQLLRFLLGQVLLENLR